MQRIGRYELLNEIGRGAMGVVYRARDTQIGRIVALKLILTRSASPAEAEHYKLRFQREAQAAGRLSHPGIVTLHDIAEDSAGQPYIVMEFIEGKPLNLFFGSTAQIPLDRVLDIAIQVAQALGYAHQRGVVHRDIKPENIMVTRDGRAKIADFGIAKLAGADMTQEGTSLGTPAYMSPEQIRGDAVDARSDLFSLGAVLYWMCTGQKPFAGESVTTITFQVVFQDPARPRELKPGLPPDLDHILNRCLAKNPADRYANCAELAADLEALRAGRPLAPASAAGAQPQPVPATADLSAADKPSSAQHPDPSLPLAAPAEATRLLSTTSAGPAATTPSAPASAARARIRRLAWFAPVAALLLAVLIVGLYHRGHRAPASQPVAPPAAAVPPATPPTSTATPPAAAGNSLALLAPPSAAPASSPRGSAASTSLHILCKHNFQLATLEIFVDDQPFLRATLKGKEVGRFMTKRYEGKFQDDRTIPAGRHSLRVRVHSPRDNYDDQDSVAGEFTEGEPRTLEIEFGRGSGLRMTERSLSLTLH